MTPKERLLQMHIDWFPRGKWYRYGEKCTWIGKNVEFFLVDSFCIPKREVFAGHKIAFYAGEPSEKQEQLASKLMELMENIDEVISSERRFKNVAENVGFSNFPETPSNS